MRATRWPRRVDPGVYERVRSDFVRRVVATGEVRAVYQMGGVGAPGLSDLDLIVIVNDPVGADVNAAADIRAGGDDAAYVLMHGQFLMNEDLFRNIETVFFGSDLRHVWGEEIERAPLVPAEAPVFRFVFNVEMILSALARLVRVQASDVAFPVRPTIAALNGVKFNLAMAREWTTTPRGDRYVADLDALRAHWFDLSREEAWARVEALNRDAVTVLGDLLDGLAPTAAAYCGGEELAGVIRALEVHELHRFGPLPFSYDLQANRLGSAFPERLRRSRRLAPHLAPLLELRLPAAYFGLFALQAVEFAQLGEVKLARHVDGPMPKHPRHEVVDAMRKRAQTVVAMHRFVARNRLRGASYPIPLSWQRPFPWKHRIKAKLLAAVGVGAS